MADWKRTGAVLDSFSVAFGKVQPNPVFVLFFVFLFFSSSDLHEFEPKSALVWSVVSFSARPSKHLQESGEGKNGLIRMKSMSCIPSCSLCLDRRRLARVTSSPVCPLTMQPVR